MTSDSKREKWKAQHLANLAEQKQMSRKVVIHTDGSASTKDRTGGWGFVARYNGAVAMRCGHVQGTTISIMEITAIMQALKFLTAADIPVVIYTDSQYAKNALTTWGDVWEVESWITSQGKHVANVDLIKSTRRIIALHKTIRPLEIEWVRGHAGTKDNEIADDLAGKARRHPHCATWKSADWKFHKDYEEKFGVPGEFLKSSVKRHLKTI